MSNFDICTAQGGSFQYKSSYLESWEMDDHDSELGHYTAALRTMIHSSTMYTSAVYTVEVCICCPTLNIRHAEFYTLKSWEIDVRVF